MGDRYGPMVVARRAMTLDELAGHDDCRARALLTTAYLALRLCLGSRFPSRGRALRPDPRCGRAGRYRASRSTPG